MPAESDILATIIKRRQPALEFEKQVLPLTLLQQAVAQLPPDNRSFAAALTQETPAGINIIAELKKASPSKGIIRPDLDATLLAAQLENAGAAALSVLTEPDFFAGSRENLMRARAATTHIPLLRKDFIFDAYQIYQARLFGASAVLLIAAMLTPTQLLELSQVADALNLVVLYEIHSAAELEKVLPCHPQIIGVNARNLHSFHTSLATALELIAQLPTHVIKVCESAVKTPADLHAAQAAGAHACLVGETLMRAELPAKRLQELLYGN